MNKTTSTEGFTASLEELARLGCPVDLSVAATKVETKKVNVAGNERFTLQQVDHELARLYELPCGEIAVVVFATLTVLRSRVWVRDPEITTPWDSVLELGDAEENSYYKDLVSGWPVWPPKWINRWLTHHVPSTFRREEGAIFAICRGSVPPEFNYQAPVALKLFLREGGNERCFDFVARVDRIVKQKYERRGRELRKASRLAERASLFELEDGQIGDQRKMSLREGGQPSDGSLPSSNQSIPETVSRGQLLNPRMHRVTI